MNLLSLFRPRQPAAQPQSTPSRPNRLLVFTGAGLSAESGLGTFRGSGGLWQQHRIQDVANLHTFDKNKKLIFDFYNERRQQHALAEPHIGHRALAELQQRYGVDRVQLCTQNVDNLLEKAGARNVLHVHGNIFEMQCRHCDHRWPVDAAPVDPDCACPTCGVAYCKPGVVFFHEHAPNYAHMDALFNPLARQDNDIVLVIGTRFDIVPHERILGHRFIPRTDRGFKILANLDDQDGIDLACFDHVALGPITETMPALVELITAKMG